MKKFLTASLLVFVFISSAQAQVVVPIRPKRTVPAPPVVPIPANDPAATLQAAPEESATAGAVSIVYVCINAAAHFSSPVNFNFRVKSKTCMNSSGEEAQINVSEAGVNCVSIGKVESRYDPSCSGGKARWEIGYDSAYVESGAKAPYSGYAKTKWIAERTGGNIVSFVSQSRGTVICPSELRCNDIQQRWVGTKDFYIIFNP